MTEHKFTERISKKSLLHIAINCIRKDRYEKTFINKSNGTLFKRTDVQIMRFKRDKLLKEFFSTYGSINFTMIEIGFDFSVNARTSEILVMLKRNLNKINLEILGYAWIVDKGDIYGQMHFHLVVAIPRIDYKGDTLPNCLKLKFKDKKIHSKFVSNKPKLLEYLLNKEIYYIGKRKRVYGKSRSYYNDYNKSKKNLNN